MPVHCVSDTSHVNRPILVAMSAHTLDCSQHQASIPSFFRNFDQNTPQHVVCRKRHMTWAFCSFFQSQQRFMANQYILAFFPITLARQPGSVDVERLARSLHPFKFDVRFFSWCLMILSYSVVINLEPAALAYTSIFTCTHFLGS